MKPYTPEPEWTEEIVSRDSDPLNTVEFMEELARENSWQVSDLAYTLRGETTYETCKNIWY